MPDRFTLHCLTDTALILIDIQQGFDDPVWGRRNNPAADATAAFAANVDFGWLAGPAPAADPETIHRFALAHLHGEFATVVTTARILEETRHDRPRPPRLPAVPRAHSA